MDHRFATAVHECGHLLAAWERNIVIQRVAVFDGGGGVCEPLASLSRYPADDVRFFCYAGAAAEGQLAGVYDPPSDGDLGCIHEAGAGFMSLTEVRAMQERTDRWAFENKAVLKFLAGRLLSAGRFHAQLLRGDLARLTRTCGLFKEYRHLYPDWFGVETRVASREASMRAAARAKPTEDELDEAWERRQKAEAVASLSRWSGLGPRS